MGIAEDSFEFSAMQASKGLIDQTPLSCSAKHVDEIYALRDKSKELLSDGVTRLRISARLMASKLSSVMAGVWHSFGIW